MRETERGGSVFLRHTKPVRTRLKRERWKLLERRSRRLLDSGSQTLQEFRRVFKRERAFVRGTSGERELGVQELRVRSPFIKFFFHSEVCMSRGGEPFCG